MQAIFATFTDVAFAITRKKKV